MDIEVPMKLSNVSASFNTANRSNYNVPPPIRNSYNQQFAPPPPQQEPYIRNDQYQRYQDVQANRHSGTQNSYNTLNSQHLSNQEPYISDQGYRTIPPQSFHSEPRRDRYDNWMPNYEQYRPRRRVWRPPVTNNFNFINVPFNHQFYGYPQQAQQMIDYAQSAASMATLRTSFQHDYNIARNTQRIITVKEEDEDDGDVVYVGTHQKNPKLISSKRKRKSSSTGTSSSSPQGSDESVTIETASNSTLTSQVPSKQSRSDSKMQQWPRSPSSSSAYSLEPNPFSSAPELTTYQREVQTPIPEMIGLKISTVADAKVDDDVEDGEIVAENDCAKIFPTKSEIPLDRLPEFMPKPAKEIEPNNEEHNTSVVSTILPPSHPDYNPLLDDFDDDGPTTFDASSFALDDEDDLLNDYDAEAEKKAQEDEDHVLKKFPDLKLTDNSDDHMNE
uniref:Uncharacterized protein n=1 Tax=Panagrolaimus superbus TaxID=310955 RepID=A0A914YKS9_9BILA